MDLAKIWQRYFKPKQEAGQNLGNTWYRYEKSNETVIVLVHGLLSSAEACWKANNGAFWPEYIRTDEEFNSCNIFLGSYHTSIASGSYDIAQCAREQYDELLARRGGTRSVMDHTNILFLCHSLGGIVCRRLIEENQKAFEQKTIGLLLYASPTLGSDWAKTFARVAQFYNHSVVDQLLPGSAALRDIDNRFRAVLDNRHLKIVGAEAVEHWGPARIRWLPNIFRPIVASDSASRYFGPERQIPETDHFNIVKPDSPNSGSHKFLQSFFQTKYRPQLRVKPTVQTLATLEVSTSPPRDLALFDIYTPQCRSYYVERPIDKVVAEAIALRSVWITGRSGVGKTSVLRRYIDLHSIRPVEVTLSQLTARASQADVTREIFESLAGQIGRADQPAQSNEIDGIAAMCGHGAVPLFIDEVPIALDEMRGEVVSTIGAILERVKRRVHSSVRIFVCSANNPIEPLTSGKFREAFSVIDVPVWDEASMHRLIDTVQQHAHRQLSAHERANLVLASGGSPRYVKTFFRNLHIHRHANVSTAEVMAMTSDELKGL